MGTIWLRGIARNTTRWAIKQTLPTIGKFCRDCCLDTNWYWLGPYMLCVVRQERILTDSRRGCAVRSGSSSFCIRPTDIWARVWLNLKLTNIFSHRGWRNSVSTCSRKHHHNFYGWHPISDDVTFQLMLAMTGLLETLSARLLLAPDELVFGDA
jgi:hypothetical protein